MARLSAWAMSRQPVDLIGRELPRSGVELDVEVDVGHVVPEQLAVAHLVERVGLGDGVDRRRDEDIVDAGFVGAIGIDDIAVARNSDHRRRHVDEHLRLRAGEAVVDDHDLAAVAVPPHAPQQMALVIVDVDDLHAVRTQHDGVGLVAAPLDMHIAGADRETVDLVVADDHPVVFLDDGAVGLLNEHLVALARFVALLVQRLDGGGGRLAFRREELGFVDRLSRWRDGARVGARGRALDRHAGLHAAGRAGMRILHRAWPGPSCGPMA